MPLIISKDKSDTITADAICVNDGPFLAAEAEKDANRYIIHAGEPPRSFYLKSLERAKELGLSSIAMPLLKQEGNADIYQIAADTIIEFLDDNEMTVYLLANERESLIREEKLYADIQDYLEQAALSLPYCESLSENGIRKASLRPEKQKVRKKHEAASKEAEETYDSEQIHAYDNKSTREDEETDASESFMMPDAALPYPKERFIPDESFSECLIRMIDERHLSDPEVYKKANIDRKHFNHIINSKNYRPKKETAVALAIGLQLDMNDTGTLLERAGFVLSRSSKFDLIIRYCIEHQIYDIYDINEILFTEDQKTLGC